MGGAAVTSDASEESGLSILDITKHAAKTVVKLLNDDDKLTIIKFTDAATTLMAGVSMTESNRTSAITAISALCPLSCTNLWDGLHQAMIAVSTSATPNMLSTIFLLTDGVPNVEPPRGHIPMLKMFLDANPDVHFTVNTFGFGYSLKSDLLLDIAKTTGGNYSFIPDASFVGTVFVHAAANALSMFAQSATLSVELPTNVSSADVVVLGTAKNSQLVHKKTSWGIQIEIGAIEYDQERAFILLLPTAARTIAAPSVKLTYFDVNDGDLTVETEALTNAPVDDLQLLRLATVDAISVALEHNQNDYTFGESAVQAVIDAIKSVGDPESSGLGPLLVDVSGQITEALSKKEYYTKWGKHYLPAIARAHLLQMCTNFKDPGMQGYGGPAFNAIRDAADAIFMSMPAPTPTRTVYDAAGRSCRASAMSSQAYST
jgi:hypothetical protein